MHLFIHKSHIKQLALFYLICFGLNQCWFLYHGLYFAAIAPVFYLQKLDITGTLLLGTGMHQAILEYASVRWIFDIVFIALPFLMYQSVVKQWKLQSFLAICTALFSMLYCYFFSSMSLVSIEVFIAWMMFPFIFSGKKLQGFYFRLHSIRYLFVLFFFSAALWKLRAGGGLNGDQFSAILLQQHLPVLLAAPQHWFSEVLFWLIQHPTISFLLYLLATAIEFVFVIAFFTKKYDRFLAVLLLGFLLFDYFLMEINYFPWLPFVGCLYFSRYKLPASSS